MGRIPDDDFCGKLPDIMKDVRVDNKNSEILSERYGPDKEKPRCVIKVAASASNNLSRGHVTKENLIKHYKQHMSDKKTDALINQILIHHEHQYKSTPFGNVQDVFANTNLIVRQNRAILRLLQELVESGRNDKNDN